MRILFYSRPAAASLHLALADYWQRSGREFEARYLTQHAQAAAIIRRSGREVDFVPDLLRSVEIDDPASALERVELRHRGSVRPMMGYLMSERFFARADRHWQVEHLARHAVLYDEYLAHFHPDLVVGDAPDMMPAWLLYDLSVAHGCETAALLPSAIPPGRLIVLRKHDDVAGARSRYEELRASKLTDDETRVVREIQTIVLGRGTEPDYLPSARDRWRVVRRILVGEILREHLAGTVWRWRERASGNWHLQPRPFINRLSQPFREIRARWADQRLTDAPSGRPFVFYPLHMEPEAAILVHGSYFESQLEVIRNLARSLPAGWDLLVKEHYAMRGRRKLGFYRALHRVPNVRVMSFSEPTNRLVTNARIIAVLSGTVGLEASVVGRPVIMFGERAWDYAPTIRKVGRLYELPDLIREVVDLDLGPDHPDVMAFVASWAEALPKGRYFVHRDYDWLEPANIADIARALEVRVAHGADQDQSERV